jgi:hypothetical protein
MRCNRSSKVLAIAAVIVLGLGRYFALYNFEQPHQALGYCTPAEVYGVDARGSGSLASLRQGLRSLPLRVPWRWIHLKNL